MPCIKPLLLYVWIYIKFCNDDKEVHYDSNEFIKLPPWEAVFFVPIIVTISILIQLLTIHSMVYTIVYRYTQSPTDFTNCTIAPIPANKPEEYTQMINLTS